MLNKKVVIRDSKKRFQMYLIPNILINCQKTDSIFNFNYKRDFNIFWLETNTFILLNRTVSQGTNKLNFSYGKTSQTVRILYQ